MLIIITVLLIITIICLVSRMKSVKKENVSMYYDLANTRLKVNELQKQNTELDAKVKEYYQKSGELSDIINEIERERESLRQLEVDTTIATYNFSDYDKITSEECKNEIAMLKTQEQQLIKSGQAVICSVDREAKGMRKLCANNERQILRCFNTECDNILLAVTFKNIDTLRNKLQKSFETLNKIFEVDNVQLTDKLLDIKLKEISLTYTAELKKEAEREEQKAIKAQMLEEEKVRREIEREKNRIEKEEHQFRNEISKLMKYLQKASDIEKQLYIDKIQELEDKLKLLEKDKENVLQREQNTRAGYVYVISNIGSFGENIYKIGMTRRLEPMDRVKELGNASVPFEFDVHAMIFSEDAPKLENILHETFRENQVNKVNPRKEFYNVPLEKIEEVVKNNYNATVTFTMIAQATQYRESLKLSTQSTDNN